MIDTAAVVENPGDGAAARPRGGGEVGPVELRPEIY